MFKIKNLSGQLHLVNGVLQEAHQRQVFFLLVHIKLCVYRHFLLETQQLFLLTGATPRCYQDGNLTETFINTKEDPLKLILFHRATNVNLHLHECFMALLNDVSTGSSSITRSLVANTNRTINAGLKCAR